MESSDRCNVERRKNKFEGIITLKILIVKEGEVVEQNQEKRNLREIPRYPQRTNPAGSKEKDPIQSH